MVIVRMWLLVLVATVVSWVILKLLKKPIHIGWLFLLWVLVLFGGTALFYGVSVWFVSSQ